MVRIELTAARCLGWPIHACTVRSGPSCLRVQNPTDQETARRASFRPAGPRGSPRGHPRADRKHGGFAVQRMTRGIGMPTSCATDDFAHRKTREQTEMAKIIGKRESLDRGPAGPVDAAGRGPRRRTRRRRTKPGRRRRSPPRRSATTSRSARSSRPSARAATSRPRRAAAT